MWISEPMPVTTRIITADSGSSRSVKARRVRSPDAIQLNTSLNDVALLPAASATSRHDHATPRRANDTDHRAARDRAGHAPC